VKGEFDRQYEELMAASAVSLSDEDMARMRGEVMAGIAGRISDVMTVDQKDVPDKQGVKRSGGFQKWLRGEIRGMLPPMPEPGSLAA
jgi:hypothetical protein